jgi:glycosyltransferase involved in cell wall biosynthesis
MKETVKLSFIVSVYNTEQYLEECVNSILNQNVKNSEIILVDDGSTDESPDLCDRYASQYESIRVIHKKNGGISSARNRGLAVAGGAYVCFVDSDDFFHAEFANEFLEICKKENLDIIRGWYGIFEDGSKIWQAHPFPAISFANKTVTGYEFLERSVKEHANEVVPWLGFFRRDYLMEHELFFPAGIAYEEDHLFFLKTLVSDPSCRAYQSELEFYAYRMRAGSATKTPTLRQVEDILYVVENETKILEQFRMPKNVRSAVLKYICASFYQLTSIYGRLRKEDAKKTAEVTPFWMKWQCICHPYNWHQAGKIFLFTFARWAVDLVYKRRGIS